MYETHFGFREKPFTLHPDPDYLYLSDTHAEVVTHLEYALQENQGFVVVTGEVGSGKTTLINHLRRRMDPGTRVGVVNNTAVPPYRFLRVICDEFGLSAPGFDPVELTGVFNRFLVEQFAAGRRVVLIVDEAQNLPLDTLEELRMLSNLETEKAYLLQLVLVGQPQLRGKLEQRGMEQLVQRVTVHCHLGPLTDAEVRTYVRHRLHVAGARDLAVFDEGALEAIQTHARGIPRLVNLLCDTSLVYAYAEGQRTVCRSFIDSVVEGRRVAGLWEVVEPASGSGASDEVLGRLGHLERRADAADEALARIDQRLAAALDRVRVLIDRLKAADARIDQRLARLAEPPAPAPRGGVLSAIAKRLF